MDISGEDKKKIEYVSYVESMLSVNFKSQMMELLDMGFSDYKLNEKLLEKYKGNIS